MIIVYGSKVRLGAEVNTGIVAFHVEPEDVEAVAEVLVLAMKTQAYMEQGFDLLDDE